MGRFDEQMSRMKGLMNYGVVSEDANHRNSAIEYTAEAADGKIYGIVREGTKFFIKRAEKGKETLAESFDYIGGWNNKKDYEYTSYNNALKQFELKVRSINEAITGKGNFNALDVEKRNDLVIEATDKMAKEIARQRQIMANVGENLNEATISISNTGVPEAPKTTSFSAKLGKPFDETATATLDKDMKKTASDPKAQSEPFGENEKAEEFKDAQYVPQGSVANQKPTGGKVVRVNESNIAGQPDEDMTSDVFADEYSMEGVEDEEMPMDDDTIEMDDEIEDDVELDGESEMEPEMEPELDDEMGDDEEMPMDDEMGDDESTDERIDDLEMMIQQIMDELGLDDEESDDEDLYDDEESDDEDDLYDDEESDDEDLDVDFEEFDDEDVEEEGGELMESRKRNLDRIVEAVTGEFMRGNKTKIVTGTKIASSIAKAKSLFAKAVQNDLDNREDSEMYYDLGYYDEEGNLMDAQEDADDLLNAFNTFADASINFCNKTIPHYIGFFGANQKRNSMNKDIAAEAIDEVNEIYGEIAELYENALVEILNVQNDELLNVDGFMHEADVLPNGGDISGISFVTPQQAAEGLEGVVVQDNNFGDYSPYYTFLFYVVMKAVNTLKDNFDERIEKILAAREKEAEDNMAQMDDPTDDYGSEDDEFDGMSDDDIDAMAKRNAALNEDFECPWETDEFMDGVLGDNFRKFSDEDILNASDMYDDEEGEMYDSELDEDNDEDMYPLPPAPEEDHKFFENRKRRTMKEDKLNVFGKHPGYRKKPMNLPATGEDKNQWGRDWNDESVYSEEPFGSKIGSSAPFDIVQHVTDSIMEQIKKKR